MIENKLPSTVVIAGSGINSIGWEPIHSAIDQLITISKSGFKTLPPREIVVKLSRDPIFFIAQISNRMRAMYALLRNPNSLNQATAIQNIRDLATLRASLTGLIEANILKSETSAHMRPIECKECEQILNREDLAFISLNWDTLLEKAYQGKRVVHVHGAASKQGTLLLPTENVILDKEMFTKPQGVSPVSGFTPPANIHSDLNSETREAIDLVQNARHLVVWGSSLDSYDAEIQMVITTAITANAHFQDGSLTVTLMNPSGHPAHRLKLLTLGEVRWLDPTNRYVCES